MKEIFVECYNDKILIENILKEEKKINHCGSNSQVCRQLKNKEKTIGVIDGRNKEVLPYFKETKFKYKQEKKTLGLELYIDEKENKLIIIYPELEEWILEALKESKISVENFELPDNPADFKRMAQANPSKFQPLLHNLIKEGNKRIAALKELLEDNF